MPSIDVLVRPRMQNGEFVAADSGHQIVLADDGTQSRHDGPQQRIAKGMAAGVVDGFEFVEI